MLSNCHT